MNYIKKKLNLPFEKAINKLTVALLEEKFGIISEINMKEIFKKKINADFRNYKILGACNPDFAYKALLLEDKIGMLLPCNIIVQEQGEELVEISVLEPLYTMADIDNIKLKVLAFEIGEKLKKVLTNL